MLLGIPVVNSCVHWIPAFPPLVLSRCVCAPEWATDASTCMEEAEEVACRPCLPLRWHWMVCHGRWHRSAWEKTKKTNDVNWRMYSKKVVATTYLSAHSQTRVLSTLRRSRWRNEANRWLARASIPSRIALGSCRWRHGALWTGRWGLQSQWGKPTLPRFWW